MKEVAKEHYDEYLKLYGRGDILFTVGAYQLAIEVYQQFFENYRNNKIPLIHPKYNWYAKYRCGVSYLYLGNLPKALEYFKDMSKEECKLEVQPYDRQGIIQLFLGDFTQVLQNLANSVNHINESLDQYDELTLFHSSIFRFVMGEDAKAIEEINKALALNALQVKAAAATLCEKISNKDSVLYNDSEKIIAYLEDMGCLERKQKPSRNDIYFAGLYRNMYFKYSGETARKKGLTVNLLDGKEVEIDSTITKILGLSLVENKN